MNFQLSRFVNSPPPRRLESINQDAINAAVEAALQKQRRLRKPAAVSDDEDQDDDTNDSRASTNASSGMLGRFFRGGR